MTQRTLLQAERDRLRGSTLEVLRERPAKALRAYHDVCKEILLKFIPELGTGTSVLQSGVWTTPFIRMVGELPDSQIGFVDLMLRTSMGPQEKPTSWVEITQHDQEERIKGMPVRMALKDLTLDGCPSCVKQIITLLAGLLEGTITLRG